MTGMESTFSTSSDNHGVVRRLGRGGISAISPLLYFAPFLEARNMLFSALLPTKADETLFSALLPTKADETLSFLLCVL